MMGVNMFLVSQCNPWLLGVVALKHALPRVLGRMMEEELKHRRVQGQGVTVRALCVLLRMLALCHAAA